MANDQRRQSGAERPPVLVSGESTLATALERNISALVQRRAREARQATLQERIASGVSRFAGSMFFVYLHAALFGFWVLINTGVLPLVDPWDPTLVALAVTASLESIFLATFVLINQNRMAAEDDRRADLNLQIDLLNEHETTRLLKLVAAISQKLGIDPEIDADLSELQKDVAPEAVLDRIEAEEERS